MGKLLSCYAGVASVRLAGGGDRQPLASLGKDKGYSSHDEAIPRKKINVEIRLRCAALRWGCIDRSALLPFIVGLLLALRSLARSLTCLVSKLLRISGFQEEILEGK